MQVKEISRELSTTGVLNIHADTRSVLQHLISAFMLMCKARLYCSPNIPKCYIQFNKDTPGIVYKSVDCDPYSCINFDLYPTNYTENLIALEDLGRGSIGKAWLCITLSTHNCAPCVLKFDNIHTTSPKLKKEFEMWNCIYPEFMGMVRFQSWSGSDALVMPHFSTILDSERDAYRNNIDLVLRSKFQAKGKIHNDVRWQNIGKYKCKVGGSIVVVVYDLESVTDIDESTDPVWIENAINKLFT